MLRFSKAQGTLVRGEVRPTARA